MYDLAVIGAGPAGSAAAITAAKTGAKVVLLEKGSFPRQKVCGEFVSAESLDILARLLGPSQQNLLSDAVRIPKGRICAYGRVVPVAIEPAGASITRLDLDSALWTSAQDSEVDSHPNSAVIEIEQTGDGKFRLKTADAVYEARSVVNATGRWSNLNRVEALPSDEKWIGIKAHFSEAMPQASVDLYFFEGGYCGVQPVNLMGDAVSRRVNVSAMVRADVATTLPEVFAMQAELGDRSRHWEILGSPVTTSPLLFRPPQCSNGNVLRVGDAAAFVDPFVGDGISLALRSGVLAASSLERFWNGSITLDAAIASYVRSHAETLGHVFQASSQLRRLLRLPAVVRKPLLFVMEKAPFISERMVRSTR
jgi:menaquinone-9 beta-reductase